MFRSNSNNNTADDDAPLAEAENEKLFHARDFYSIRW